MMRNILMHATLLVAFAAQSQDYKNYPMWNPALPMEQRVNDLVSRLTLEEKVAQLLNAAPAVPRLGIPAYDWWNEVLHGVARTPFKTTVFPQAIGMAATWDTLSLQRMADISATEGRAIFTKATALGRTNERYLGLTYWTPNINIFRDPRWGRGQETYGEDPCLTGTMGAAFVRGLQGNDPKYLKAAACAKHFAVHSGPEPSRHSDNFDPTAYDLWDTYLPAFKKLVVGAQVAGLMCAYNAVYKQPCCASDLLMNDILRKRWNFTGYVTSDCWALDDFFRFHKTHPNATAAAVDALYHSTDVECGVSVYSKLTEAVKSGMIKEADLDVSMRRLFTIRYRLGMFDPAGMVPWANTPESMLEAPAHKEHALKMARQSIVLLKNEGNTLPLGKGLKRIAVLGPNADNRISVLGNYNGIPSRIVTVLDGLHERLGSRTEVVYEQAINFANDTLFVADNNQALYSYQGKPGVQVTFFNNRELTGEPVYTGMVPAVDFHWSEGETPAPGVPNFRFSGRYVTYITPSTAEHITLQLQGDDGYRLKVNDSTVVDAWQRNRWGSKTWNLQPEAGKTYKLTLEFWQNEGVASIRLVKGSYQKTDVAALLKHLGPVDAYIFAGGISPQLEGEEMPVAIPGFKGGDRTSILLPAVQTELLKQLKATGKPVVFVMMTGSAVAIPWENDNLAAIVNAWYGGQSAGMAIADVLFGDYNPAGRLPVTFYSCDSDLPDFKSYDMTGRTYRYFTGKPLYPFGYGLSYTRFNYGNMNAPATAPSGKPITVGATVTNTGSRDGEEVVQLYISYAGSGGKSAIRALKGFTRIALKRGESRTVRFTLSADDLAMVNERGESYWPAGKLKVSIGGGQPGQSIAATSNVIEKTINLVK
jgi:beta-glucosidase